MPGKNLILEAAMLLDAAHADREIFTDDIKYMQRENKQLRRLVKSAFEEGKQEERKGHHSEGYPAGRDWLHSESCSALQDLNKDAS